MKLAEALLLRADMQKKICSLRERISLNAVVQEGDTPHENPQSLLKEAMGVLSESESLIARINRSNTRQTLPDGRTVMEAIAHRDMLAQQHALLQSAIEGSRREPDRWSGREIKWLATMDIAELHRRADEVSSQIRRLNGEIQETNWRVELEE
jgi:hypothetical protein